MNAELVTKALEKIGNPNILVNMLSQRVRQLNAGYGGAANPLIANTTNAGAANIALREFIEDKIGFEMPLIVKLKRPTAHGRAKPQNWAKAHAAKNNGQA